LDKTIAGITVDTKLHFTTHWAPTVENAHLNIEPFLSSTQEEKDKVKNICLSNTGRICGALFAFGAIPFYEGNDMVSVFL
jgi:hypothetical protein